MLPGPFVSLRNSLQFGFYFKYLAKNLELIGLSTETDARKKAAIRFPCAAVPKTTDNLLCRFSFGVFWLVGFVVLFF